MALTKEERNYYEQARAEDARRRDVETERDFWMDVFSHFLDNGKLIAVCAELADDALAQYRARFQ